MQVMITTVEQYHHAQEELRQLEERLHRIQQQHPLGAKGFTKAGIRKMIARLHEELAVYEGKRPVKLGRSADAVAGARKFTTPSPDNRGVGGHRSTAPAWHWPVQAPRDKSHLIS